MLYYRNILEFFAVRLCHVVIFLEYIKVGRVRKKTEDPWVNVNPDTIYFMSVMKAGLASLEKESATQIQILDETICIFLCTNDLGKTWINK